MSIESVYSIMKEISDESSKKGKESILKKHEGDMEFRKALVFLLNPYIVTGISTKKINKKLNFMVRGFIPDFDKLMEYILEHNSGKDGDIRIIQQFIENQATEELREFVKRFVTKDLKLGISEKTVNKVYGKETIPSFSVMLAESFSKKGENVEGKFYITLKLDGNRCIAIKENNEVKFFTRKGQLIDGMTELSECFKPLPNDYIYDGEVLLVNENNLSSDELFRATQKVVRKDGEKKNLEFHMFDALPVKEFKDGKSKLTYEKRREILDMEFDLIIEENNLLYILPVMYEGTDKSVIPIFMDSVEEQGFEGLMINTADGLYQNKRTTDLLKVKTMKTADLFVISVEEAIDGQFKGLLSRVNVEYKGNSVGVGSGFTLEQRKDFILNPDKIKGKIIEVQFFGESTDEKTGLLSLRFPVFKGIRHDKDIEDINYGE